MFGLAKRLRQKGILGMNQRNADCILPYNPRSLFPLVDDKSQMRDLCVRLGIPTPEIYAVVRLYGELNQLSNLLEGLQEFVIKPNKGAAGRGVLVISARQGNQFLRHNGKPIDLETIRQQASDILSGLYSLSGQPDHVLIQQRIHLHPAFQRISYKGIPDLRILLYRFEPIMAMLRLPTLESNGRANLHQGGLGVGVDLEYGRTFYAVHGNQQVDRHPDTGESLLDRSIPFWNDVLVMARKASRAIGLGYVGIDIVIDAQTGPMLLEANARPGLGIQIANQQGLIPKLQTIDQAKALAAERKIN